MALQTTRSDEERDGVPQMPKQRCPCRDQSRAEGISCRNCSPRKAYTRAGLTWRTPATGRAHVGGKRGKEQRGDVLQSDQEPIPTLCAARGCRGVRRKRVNGEKSVVLTFVRVFYSPNPFQYVLLTLPQSSLFCLSQ